MDPFDDVHNVEESNINSGYEEGIRDGAAAGILEGRELGVQKGYEIGLEIGYYTGCVALWRQLQKLDPQFLSERADKGVAALEELLATFPLGNPQDERLQDLVSKIQGKFKAVASMLGLLQDYFPREGPPSYGF